MTTTTEEPTITRCEVVIEYCDGGEPFKHQHTTVETAAIEYSTLAFEAIVDQSEDADKVKHIRQVHLHVNHADGSGLELSHLRTGFFPCKHTR